MNPDTYIRHSLRSGCFFFKIEIKLFFSKSVHFDQISVVKRNCLQLQTTCLKVERLASKLNFEANFASKLNFEAKFASKFANFASKFANMVVATKNRAPNTSISYVMRHACDSSATSFNKMHPRRSKSFKIYKICFSR